MRCPPKRYTGPSEAYLAPTAMHFYKVEYYKLIDSALNQLIQRFQQPGLKMYEELETCLLSGKVNDACATFANYPEIDNSQLSIQLAMFRQQFTFSTTDEATVILRSSVPEVRRLFNQVETLLRLLLVLPATSCEAERSFSGLRRLKTWLRSSMSQERLNSVAVCHVHQQYTDCLDICSLANTFATANDRRLLLFGQF